MKFAKVLLLSMSLLSFGLAYSAEELPTTSNENVSYIDKAKNWLKSLFGSEDYASANEPVKSGAVANPVLANRGLNDQSANNSGFGNLDQLKSWVGTKLNNLKSAVGYNSAANANEQATASAFSSSNNLGGMSTNVTETLKNYYNAAASKLASLFKSSDVSSVAQGSENAAVAGSVSQDRESAEANVAAIE